MTVKGVEGDNPDRPLVKLRHISSNLSRYCFLEGARQKLGGGARRKYFGEEITSFSALILSHCGVRRNFQWAKGVGGPDKSLISVKC